MRNMSFFHTKAQMYARIKDVTRRDPDTWVGLKTYDVVMAVEKSQGLKQGEKVVEIYPIFIEYVSLERLDLISQSEVIREGFPEWTPEQFIEFYVSAKKGRHRDMMVRRIQFQELMTYETRLVGEHGSYGRFVIENTQVPAILPNIDLVPALGAGVVLAMQRQMEMEINTTFSSISMARNISELDPNAMQHIIEKLKEETRDFPKIEAIVLDDTYTEYGKTLQVVDDEKRVYWIVNKKFMEDLNEKVSEALPLINDARSLSGGTLGAMSGIPIVEDKVLLKRLFRERFALFANRLNLQTAGFIDYFHKPAS